MPELAEHCHHVLPRDRTVSELSEVVGLLDRSTIRAGPVYPGGNVGTAATMESSQSVSPAPLGRRGLGVHSAREVLQLLG